MKLYFHSPLGMTWQSTQDLICQNALFVWLIRSWKLYFPSNIYSNEVDLTFIRREINKTKLVPTFFPVGFSANRTFLMMIELEKNSRKVKCSNLEGKIKTNFHNFWQLFNATSEVHNKICRQIEVINVFLAVFPIKISYICATSDNSKNVRNFRET